MPFGQTVCTDCRASSVHLFYVLSLQGYYVHHPSELLLSVNILSLGYSLAESISVSIPLDESTILIKQASCLLSIPDFLQNLSVGIFLPALRR
ncbi:hypothetical protein QWZ16_02835 [Vibrio ostreicida]|uniref:Uncharacterized protein n=1 Tax=Vibrio ostreicida TaxID=526588 RepID=A0ABT8BPP4_9VIBR|nr:hypothetical protein [Vibrio ostreicida]MDN3608698.1 hypothetical protein [Vibrio ostreicida]